jgi:hypothetical protein
MGYAKGGGEVDVSATEVDCESEGFGSGLVVEVVKD